MKKFLLYLSALFLSVSFANAQETYEISTSNGTLVGTESKKSAWVANDCPAGLKITATDANGKAVNTISVLNSCYKFYAVGLYPGTENLSSSPTIYTISVEDGYLITGYSMTYYPSTANKVTISNEYNYSETPSSTKVDYYMTATGLSTKSTTFTVSASNANYAACGLEFTVTVKEEGAGGEEPGDDSAIMEQYDAIAKPSFKNLGNITYVKAATLAGDVNANIDGIEVEGVGTTEILQACVTNVIEVAAGAVFDLNITYQLNWGDLAIYQIENGEATKEYGYYEGSWEQNGSTAKVAQNIANEGISVTEIVDGACTATFPITISDNHNVGDVIVVRAITGDQGANNSAYEQGISEGGYVDFLFVVAESYTLTVGETEWATLCLDNAVRIPGGVEVYTVSVIKDGYVELGEVSDVIPANCPVLVNASWADEWEFVYTSETGEEYVNLLKGTTEDEYITEEAYVLGVVDGEVGLYKAEMRDGKWLNNANKAYLPASAVPNKSAAFYGFDWDGTTGISEVATENVEVKAIFDLTGRRVETIKAPGIYIVNGVKRVVR